MRVQLALAVLLVLAPLAGAAPHCEELFCASATSASAGQGSCDQGDPAYAEVHEVALVTGETVVSVFADCTHVQQPGGPYRYREVGAVAESGEARASFTWWRLEDGGAPVCRMRVEAVTVLDLGCVAGGPPRVPHAGDTAG